jgi:hypothetical protein
MYSDEEAKRTAVIVLTEDQIPAEFHSEAMYALALGSPEQKANVAAFKQWLHDTRTYFYGRPRELFNETLARGLAVTHHCTRLILEDMS